MRLGLLGIDADTPALIEAIARRPQDQLVAVCEDQAAPAANPVRRAASLAVLDNWEALLDSELVDAVIVATHPDEDRRAEQLRKFAQARMPLLVAHPLFAAMIVYYELDMICRDTQAVFLPYLPERWHPAALELARLREQHAGGPLGQLEQLVCERHLADRGKSAVRRQFARDVDLLRAIGGDVTKIHAMGPARQRLERKPDGADVRARNCSCAGRWHRPTSRCGPPDLDRFGRPGCGDDPA